MLSNCTYVNMTTLCQVNLEAGRGLISHLFAWVDNCNPPYGSLWQPLYLNLNSISLNKQENLKQQYPYSNFQATRAIDTPGSPIPKSHSLLPNLSKPLNPKNSEIRESDRHDHQSLQNCKSKGIAKG